MVTFFAGGRDHFVLTAIDGLQRAEIFQGNARERGVAPQQIFTSRLAPFSFRIIMRAANGRYQPQSLHQNRFPIGGIGLLARVADAGVKPADRSGGKSAHHRAGVIGSDEQLADAAASPGSHHPVGVAATDVNNVGPAYFLADFLVSQAFGQKAQVVELAAETQLVQIVDGVAVQKVVSAGRWDK